MIYPLVTDLAADGVPVAVTCRVLKFSKQGYYRWKANPVIEPDWADRTRSTPAPNGPDGSQRNRRMHAAESLHVKQLIAGFTNEDRSGWPPVQEGIRRWTTKRFFISFSSVAAVLAR